MPGAGADNLLEGLAGANLPEQLFHLCLGRGNLLRAGLGGYRQQRVQQVILGLGQLAAILGGEEVVHFLGRDLDALVDVARLYPLDDHLPAHLFAHAGVGLPLLLQGLPELRHRHAVLGGDTLDGGIQLLVGNPYPHAQAQLQLDALQDEPVQGLADDLVLRGEVHAPGLHGLGESIHPLAQLAGQDDVVVNDCHHLVQGFHGRLCSGYERADKQGRQQ